MKLPIYKIINRNTGSTFEEYRYFSDTIKRVEYLNNLFNKNKFYYKCIIGVEYLNNLFNKNKFYYKCIIGK